MNVFFVCLQKSKGSPVACSEDTWQFVCFDTKTDIVDEIVVAAAERVAAADVAAVAAAVAGVN